MNSRLIGLAEQFGTPSYVYDLDAAKRRAQELRAILPQQPGTRVLYSFKANPLPALAWEHLENGCAADLTSPGEIIAAQQAGFDLGNALYGGPGKTRQEVQNALAAGIRSFSAESWHDLEQITQAARDISVRVRCLLRINPAQPPQAKLAMSGVASQFGFEEEAFAEEDRRKLRELDDVVEVEGVHVYAGTQIADAEALADCFQNALTTAENVASKLNLELRIVNLGGGFPWPYAKCGESDLTQLKPLLAQLRGSCRAAKDAQWWFESGRFLSASSGTLLTRVVDVKVSKNDRMYIIVDTGIHHLGGMSGLGRIPRFSIDVLPLTNRDGEVTADLVGQLCTPLDCLGRNLKLPNLRPGDLIAIPNVGAYGVTGSLYGFLSRPAPLEIAYRGDEIVAVHQLNTGHSTLPTQTLQPQLETASAHGNND